MTRAAALMALLALVLAGPATAQQADSLRRDTLRFRLQPVEVHVLRGTAADIRTPAAVTTIGRSALQDAQLTAGLDEALAVVPGVVVNNRYNFALGTRIAVRGLGARAAFGVRGVRLVQDGIPLTMPDGQANVNNIDLGSAGRIEVLRGPASSLYGNAAGGVVSIETEAAPASRFGAEVRTLAGDAGRDNVAALTKHQIKLGGRSQSLDYLVSASRLETDGFRAHSQAEQSVLNTRLQWTPNERSRWTLLLNFADAPTAQNPGSLPRDSALRRPQIAWPNNALTRSGEASQQIQAGIAYQKQTGSGGLNASVYGLTRSLENPLPFGFITLERTGAGARATLVHTTQVAGRELQLTAGTDLEHQSDERGEFNNLAGQQGSEVHRNQTDRVTTVGPFAQLQLALGRRSQLTLGGRYDLIKFDIQDRHLADGRNDSGDRTLSAFSPRLAFLYALTDAAAAYASVGTAFQTPTTTELINGPPPAGSPCCPGGLNDALEAQRALNVEVGVKGHLRNHIRYELAAYQMGVRDALVPFQLPDGQGREFFRNAGQTRHRGLEAALAAVLVPSVMIETAYTYSNFVFVDDGIAASAFEDNQLPGVPQHHVFLRLRLAPLKSVSVEIEDEYTDRFFVNDANTASNGSSHQVDGRLQFDVALRGVALRPFVGVNNLLDERYNSSVVINAAGGRFYEPAPGRNLYLGAAVRFGGW